MYPGEVDATLWEIIDSGYIKETLEYLDENGINPGYVSRPLYTSPVTLAAFCGRDDILETLLSMGYDPSKDCFFEGDLQNYGGKSYVANPIHMACNNGQSHIVEMLTAHGVDVDVKDSEGYTPLMYALKGKFYATHCCSYECVNHLLEVGASLNTYKGDLTYLHLAAKIESDPSICECLTFHGADVNARTGNGDTPLHIAVQYCEDTVLTLLDAEADPNLQNEHEETPFLCTINSDRLKWDDKTSILHLLCDYGANPDMPDRTGNTALTYAVRDGAYDVVQFLVLSLNVGRKTKGNRQVQAALVINKLRERLEKLKRRGDVSQSDKDYLRCIKLIVHAGFNIRPMMSEYDFESVLDRVPDEKDCIRYLKQMSSNPRTLQELSCFQIRRNLGRRIERNVECLPVPKRMKDVILLKTIVNK